MKERYRICYARVTSDLRGRAVERLYTGCQCSSSDYDTIQSRFAEICEMAALIPEGDYSVAGVLSIVDNEKKQIKQVVAV